MKLIYDVNDKPKFSELIVFAIQQLLAIMTATLVVPVIIGNGMSPAAALFGAGAGTLVYILFTKGRSPVFLGSSFAFLGSMAAAFSGSVAVGYLGLILGAVFAGAVYVLLALIIKFVGVKWISKLMPPVVIGPTVAIIGLSLAGNAVGDLLKSYVTEGDVTKYPTNFAAVLCGLITLAVTMIASSYGKRVAKLIPFIIGIGAGYVAANIITAIGYATNNDYLLLVNYQPFIDCFSTISISSFIAVPEFTFLTAVKGFGEITMSDIGTVAVAYVPVAFVVFAEHIADHKNLSSIIGRDLLEDPGLHRTLLGDGIGSMVGALFGGCPNTTYGESVGCVAITRNASVRTIIATSIGAMLIAFLSPFVALVNSIPSCVMGGVCMALYGFIAVSGLKMIKDIDLDKNKNLFVVSVILIAGVGGLTLNIGRVKLTEVACALILGILTNLLLHRAKEETEEKA